MCVQVANMERLIFIIALIFSCCSKTKSSTYRAGVVEYAQTLNETYDEMIRKNLNNYLNIIREAGEKAVDILVFPEATLNRDWYVDAPNATAVLLPPDDIIICDVKNQYSELLEKLSCAARESNLYVVVNIGEAANCEVSNSNCDKNGKLYFNTNIVFDRKGRLISRYRKINLYGEYGYTESLDRKLGVFETDFGVKFGHFICFDILFKNPAESVIAKGNLTDVIFSTMWYSEMPTLTAIEIQQSYAFAHNVNFLASGASFPHFSTTGSGIYSGRAGAMISTLNYERKTELLIADVPRKPGAVIIDGHKTHNASFYDSLLLHSYNMSLYNSQLIDENDGCQTYRLSYDKFTCDFNIEINKNAHHNTEDNHYSYRAVIFNGVRSFTYKSAYIVECAIVACTSKQKIDDCARRFSNYSNVKPAFEISYLKISTNVSIPTFEDGVPNSVYYPVSLLSNIMPLTRNEFDYIEKDLDKKKMSIDFIMKKPQLELLTFGIFGRQYNLDHLPISATAAN